MKRVVCFCMSVWLAMSAGLVFGAPAEVNVNNPTADKNWFSGYKESPMTNKPNLAPPVIGVKSMSANSLYDYKQSLSSLKTQAGSYYIDAFKEVFQPGNQRVLKNLVDKSQDSTRVGTNTGNYALDSYEPEEFSGLSEDELKWLLNNHIISRDPEYVSVSPDEIVFDYLNKDEIEDLESMPGAGMDFLLSGGLSDTMKKSDFLMALHKGTYGLIESRPLVFEIIPYRWASKVTWTPVTAGSTVLYRMNVGEERYQRVNTGQVSDADRGEFKTRLEGDTNYVVATFPEMDKLFVTSPNVTELYLKSLLDKGVIASANLVSDLSENPGSKNVLRPVHNLKVVFDNYGRMINSQKQAFPWYAPELSPVEKKGGVVRNHTHFAVSLLNPQIGPWGARYDINMDGVVKTIALTKTGKEPDFFEHESMTTMDALKFIETILRAREGDMTDTEAMIVSYKYGVNVVESLHGSDKSTVMYLTAKGILNFEDNNEYTFLYDTLGKSFAYTLLYRVSNPAARKNFSQMQLTDSDNFWIDKGYSSFAMTVRTPDTSKVQSYTDKGGKLVVDPLVSVSTDTDKSALNIMPFVETQMICVANPKGSSTEEARVAISRAQAILAEAAQGNVTSEMVSEYSALKKVITAGSKTVFDTSAVTYVGDVPVLHPKGLDIYDMAGVDLYENRSPKQSSAPSAVVVEKSPFGSGKANAVDDKIAQEFAILKLFDDPYKYLFDKCPIVDGQIPATREARVAQNEEAKTTAGEAKVTAGEWSLPLHKDASKMITSVKYDNEYDKYSVTFLVSASSAMAAEQLVTSKLETTANALTKSNVINVVSKRTESGKEVILVDKASLPLIDPDVVVVEDKVLWNRRTGAKAVILTEQNIALVGNHVIDAEGGALMIEMNETRVFYNLDIISAILSNAGLASIGIGDYYSLRGVQTEEYLPVYSNRGDKIATAIVGTFPHMVLPDSATAGDALQEETRSYANVSQLMTGNGILIKDFVKETEKGAKVKFSVVVEWSLTLPDSSENLASVLTTADTNPSIKEINNFYSTRPSDNMRELQDFWDNNMAVNNALANVMYGTTKVDYLTCGYLMPHVSFLFDIDDPGTGGVETSNVNLGTGNNVSLTDNLLLDENMQVIAGAWFQEVGNELPQTWVSRFFGDSALYNKILRSGDNTEKLPDHYRKYAGSLRLVDEDGIVQLVSAYESGGELHGKSPAAYYVATNEGSRYYTDKKIEFNQFPAWVHTAFNNSFVHGTSQYDTTIASNGFMWRRLSSDRGFDYYPRKERRSYGSVYGTTSRDKVTWVVLPSGSVYKSMIAGVRYRRVGDGIVIDTRTSTTDYGLLVTKTVSYGGSKYYVSRFDNQYLELISLDAVEGVCRDGEFWVGDVPMQQSGHATISERFVNAADTLDAYRVTGNVLPPTLYAADVPYLITDAAGGTSVRKYTTQNVNGVDKLVMSVLQKSEYENKPVKYQPVVRLSVLGWDVVLDAEGTRNLQQRRTIPALLFNDMYESSLMRTVADSMVAKSVEVTKVSDLPTGSTIQVGDVFLHKVDDGYVTSPFKILSTDNLPLRQNGVTSVGNLARTASGVLNMVVDANGKPESLANYINQVSLAPVVHNDMFKYANTMVASDNNSLYEACLATSSGVKRLADDQMEIASVSYKVGLDDGLLCIPTGTDSKSYELLFATDGSGSGAATSVPYFADDADFYVRNQVNLESFSSNFKPLPNQHELREEFKEADRAQTAKDIKYWVQAVLCYVLAYLMVMCTLMFFALKITTFEVLVRGIKHSFNGTKGPDVVQWLTLCIMDVDHEISGGRFFTSMMLLCLLFAIIILI